MSEDTKKYQPIHIDFYNTTLKKIIEESLDPDLTKTHSVAEIIQRPCVNGEIMWLVRLQYNFMKDHEERSKVQI